MLPPLLLPAPPPLPPLPLPPPSEIPSARRANDSSFFSSAASCASASEIFAGAIQDYRRGVVVGQRSFGKGTVQNLVPLSRWSARPVNGQLTVTIGKFYRVTGESTQHRGVEPDVTLASPINLKDIGESSLPDALPWDRIQGAPFATVDTPIPSITRLLRAEAERQARDPDYRWLVNDISAMDQLRSQRSVSLNLETRRKERERLESERLARENARRAARSLPPLPSIEALEGDDQPDVVLDQAVEVLTAMIQFGAGRLPGSVTAQREAA
jgi:carboxyl-terminal processing protease